MTTLGEIVLRTAPMLWLGMVLGISALEAPLKFRAPGVTLEIGLGIGRLVFHALNAVELVLAALIVAALAVTLGGGGDLLGGAARVAAVVAIVVLLVQVFVLRPVLDQRLEARLAGQAVEPSRHHVAYIGLEGIKVLALATLGISVALAATRTGG